MKSKLPNLLTMLYLVLGSMCSQAQNFSVREIKGHEYSYKPSIAQRINGIKEVIVFAPKDMSEYDKYIYPCIVNYFRGLGMRVSTKYVHYKLHRESQQYLETVWKTCDEELDDYWNDSNTLLVIANNVSSFGKVTGRQENTLQIWMIDPASDFQWKVMFDLPNKSDKFDKKLRKEITQSYSYTPSLAYSPSYWRSEWVESNFRNYFVNNQYTPIEGVYEGDNYKVGVKQDSNGKYYLVYLSGASNSNDWKPGDIKAVLQPTATPTVFKADWFGKWKQKMKFTVIFKDGLMTTYDEEKTPEQYIKLYPALLSQQESESNEWSGTGFALRNGYIVTNYHVVDGAKSITISGIKGKFESFYNAIVVATDQNNDLALLKISDSSFSGFGNIPYAIASASAEVGEEIFVLGYPLTSTMGDEIKLTTGVISSKTGFQGDVAMYQISAPIQPGNSGGPLFNRKGNVIGVVSAKHAGAENVGYAIKSTYLRNLIESAESASLIPATNSVSTLPLTGKVKAEKNFVFFIHCSAAPTASTASSNSYGSNAKVINTPSYRTKCESELNIDRVILTPSETILEMSCRNDLYNGWMSISPDAYIFINGYSFPLKEAVGIALSPNTTQFSYRGETKKFTLKFPAIPNTVKSFDFRESNKMEGWYIFDVKLD